jgi:lysophospholipase L1-like esterase
MQAFLYLLRLKAPGSKILLLGILPRGDAELNKLIMATNHLYSKMAGEKQIFFVDVGAMYLPDGATLVPKDLMTDGVHPSAKGYEMLGDNLKTQLAKLGV